MNIGDRVRVISTGEVGVIRDQMYSVGRDTYLYVIKPDGAKQIIREESEIEPYKEQPLYSIDTFIADNVVVCVIYEQNGEQKFEVCRGHGHIIHEGAEGIAQALSYASKQAFKAIDTGIYFK